MYGHERQEVTIGWLKLCHDILDVYYELCVLLRALRRFVMWKYLNFSCFVEMAMCAFVTSCFNIALFCFDSL
jgi:hypothetical protein